MNFISIGGWCGTKIALRHLGLFDEPSLPFDSVRTSIEGIIDCIDNDFKNYVPKEIQLNTQAPAYFFGDYVTFHHDHHDLFDPNVLESVKRQITRFGDKVRKNNCVFLRTIVSLTYDDELKEYKRLQDAIERKYPTISYIICFIIPNQTTTQYYKHLDSKTFLFTLNDLSYDNFNLPSEYRPIFDFITSANLFTNIPAPNAIEITSTYNRFWMIDGYPMVNGAPKKSLRTNESL